jgi:hypothetical protein
MVKPGVSAWTGSEEGCISLINFNVDLLYPISPKFNLSKAQYLEQNNLKVRALYSGMWHYVVNAFVTLALDGCEWSLYPLRKNCQYPLHRRLYTPQSKFGCWVEEKNLLLLLGIEPQFLRCPAHNLVIIPTGPILLHVFENNFPWKLFRPKEDKIWRNQKIMRTA